MLVMMPRLHQEHDAPDRQRQQNRRQAASGDDGYCRSGGEFAIGKIGEAADAHENGRRPGQDENHEPKIIPMLRKLVPKRIGEADQARERKNARSENRYRVKNGLARLHGFCFTNGTACSKFADIQPEDC